MPATTTITNDPLLFDKLLAPIEAALQRLDAEPRSQAAKKLGFRLFVRVLLFRLFAQIKSLGLLVLDLRTTTAARALGLPRLGLSTLHDAFARYPHAWLVQLTQAVLAEGVLTTIPELAAFGPLWWIRPGGRWCANSAGCNAPGFRACACIWGCRSIICVQRPFC